MFGQTSKLNAHRRDTEW